MDKAIVARKMNVQAALQCMEQRCPAPCRSILDHIADGVLTVDCDGRIFWFNKAAERITGYSQEEVLGRLCYEIFRSEHCLSDGCPLRKTLGSGKPVVDQELEIQAKDGRQIPISVSTAVLRDEEGRVLGAVETFRDLSHLKKLEKDFYERYSFKNIVSRNSRMVSIFRTLRDIAASDSTVLLQGESGTGKELLALAVHDLSRRRDHPFITVNCGAIPPTLLESELFGYVRGAFTDARRDKPGRFALAQKGSIFLDEIGDLSLEVQSKLLRVIENREYQPLGGTKSFSADVRIISATNRDLSSMVRQGMFRKDLFYRLNVVRIVVPSLRERRDDLSLLISHFMGKLSSRTGKSIHSISPEAQEVLLKYSYPGNVRELENIMEYAFIMAKGRTILPRNLPPHLWESSTEESAPDKRHIDPAEQDERESILESLREHQWNKGRTAQALGVSRTTLWRRMRRLGLET